MRPPATPELASSMPVDLPTPGTFPLLFNRRELAGAFGDLGTDLPLLVGVVVASGMDPTAVFVTFGALQVLSGLTYRMPMPVQPLKAMAVVVIAGQATGGQLQLAGLMIGNSLATTVLVSRRLVDELSDKRDEVEARLALGQPSAVAAHPYVRSALRTALIPQIETTKVVGLIALPGAMTGLILAGVAPIDAVRVQASVMFLILGSVATTTTVMALGIRRRLFTADHRLRRVPGP